MGITYEGAGPELNKMVKKIAGDYHKSLGNITIATVICRRTDRHENEKNAIMTRGQEILAKIAITGLDDRVRGMADAKLTINGFTWDKLNDNQRLALLDHELQHLKAGEGADDLGRPSLKMRPHDWEVTGFADVVKRHGESSVESLQISRARLEYWSQLELFKV